MQVINIGNECAGKDAGLSVRAAVESLRSVPGARRLVFAQGVYEFWPDRVAEEYLFLSNNDSGLRRIAFPLRNFSDLEIDGQGSMFLFHGEMVPFSIIESSGITLKNLSVDFKRPFHNEAQVVGAGDGYVDLKFNREEFPFAITDGRLLFKAENGELFGSENILEFDSGKRETALMAPRNYDFFLDWNTLAEELPDGVVRLFARFDEPRPQVGNILVFGNPHRNCPAIVCDHSSNIAVTDVTIHHAGGMGLLAQMCNGIRAERLSVTPSGKRIISTTADATHFVNCRGDVELIDCLLENQMDDPVNVHGIYARITELVSRFSIEVRLVHHQQRGIQLFTPGDILEIISPRTLLTCWSRPVKSVTRLNKEYFVLEFHDRLPEEVEAGYSVGNESCGTNLTIRGCTTRGNRARGFLISAPGRVLVEDNSFHHEGPAILVEGDSNFWFESGAVRDVCIRRNIFHNCNYGYRGHAVIQISPGVSQEIEGCVPYHRNIRIEDNHFISFSRQLLKARCVDGLSFVRNHIEWSDAYPSRDQEGVAVVADNCAGITVSQNTGASDWTVVVDGVSVETQTTGTSILAD